MISHSKQLVVLVGGRGTRLDEAAKNTPKPLMEISEGKVFLDYFIESAARQGYSEILLLAGNLGEQVQARYDHKYFYGAHINVLIEPEPMGTGGAFAFAKHRMAPTFVAANGDTLFDSNIRALDGDLPRDPDLMGVIALRSVADAGRYGSVEVSENGRITSFKEKVVSAEATPGLINGGIYALRREAIDLLTTFPASIESDLFPQHVEEGRLAGRKSDGYFLDIGLPETLAIARHDLPLRKRPAVFFDRDGILNVDKNYVNKREDWEWVDGAIEAIRYFNDKNFAVVIVTNQAGVDHGYYSESGVRTLHETIQSEPNAGMLLKAANQLNLGLKASLLIGDRETDIEAAQTAGVVGHLFSGGNLRDFGEAICSASNQQ